QPAMIALSAGIESIGPAKFDTSEPGTLNWLESFVPSPPNTFAFLPCSISCCARVCAFGGCWKGAKTTSASFGTLVTIDEKSAWLVVTARRIVLTPFFFNVASAASARPTEYGSCASTSTTFLAFSLSTMYVASVGPCTESSGTTRKKPGVASRFAPLVSDVRVAAGELCAHSGALRYG